MKPEKQNLIHELLGDDSNCEAILNAGSRVLRRRRQWRRGRQVMAIVALVAAVTALYLEPKPKHPALSAISAKVVKPVAGPQVHALTDDELLGLFTNTPVGLVSLADGKKKLIFPRAGDEQRFITRF